jgi:hypothetical protein
MCAKLVAEARTIASIFEYDKWPCMWLARASPTNIRFYPDAFQRAIVRVTDPAVYRTFSFKVRNPQDQVVYHVNNPFSLCPASSVD